MLLKIYTVHGVIFDGQVELVEIPTKSGFICVLPNHNPLVSMVVPGIVKFIPVEKKGSNLINNTNFLFENDKIAISVGEGSIYIDGDNVVLFVASVTVDLKTDRESLQEMKSNLEKQIKEIKENGNIEDVEKTYLNMQKLTADLRLLDIKEKKIVNIG